MTTTLMNLLKTINKVMQIESLICFLFLFGITNARSSLYGVQQSPPLYRIKQCREGCMEKVCKIN